MSRTSQSHPLQIQDLPCRTGRIGLTFCPGKSGDSVYGAAWNRDLALDIDVIANWGASLVVTLMEPHELAELKVADLGAAVRAAGMDHALLPIVDVSTPDEPFEQRWAFYGVEIARRLEAGQRVLVHCRGGLGRTGMIAARLLVEAGEDPGAALATVRRVRPGAVETHAQEAWVRALKAPRHDLVTRSRVLGCLFAGGAGDALGYQVEFESLDAIRDRHGEHGLCCPVEQDGVALVSDDTQMTLFTLEALNHATLGGDAIEHIRDAYLDWLETQSGRFETSGAKRSGLMRHRAMWARRAPGNTCLSALSAGGTGTPEAPINNSKGCGGVMRVAPIGFDLDLSPTETFELATRAAALTHGHPSGYLSAGALALMVQGLIRGGDLVPLAEEAAKQAEAWAGGSETATAIRRAIARAERPEPHPVNDVAALGLGWVGEEALAIGLYAALVGKDGRQALIIGANHDGDSDSTAAIAGNLVGARDGLGVLPLDWMQRLDVFDASCEAITHYDRI